MSETIREKHWDWWLSTLSTRREPGAKTIVMTTRWHAEDLNGKLIKAAEDQEGDKITRLSLPAIAEPNDQLGRKEGEALWPERWPINRLEQRRVSLGSFWWNALYQQRPTAHGDAEFPERCFGPGIYPATWPDKFEAVVMALDPSKGKESKHGDYSAIVMIGLCGGKLWVDAVVKRAPVNQIVADTIAMADRYKPMAVAVEVNQFQELLLPEFDRQCQEQRVPPLPLYPIVNTVNKQVRIRRLGAYLERDQFRFRAESPGVKLLVQQLREFPLADFDDGCLVAGTMIETLRGSIPIELVRVGDMAMTRRGYRKVIAVGCTGVRPTMTLRAASGRMITGTENHPVFDGYSFTPIRSACTLWTCLHNDKEIRERQPSRKPSNSMESRSDDIRVRSNGRIGCTTHRTLDGGCLASVPCTKSFGSQSMDRSPTVTKSITATMIRSTIPSTILSASRPVSIGEDTRRRRVRGTKHPKDERDSRQRNGPLPYGTARKPGDNGIASTQGSRDSVLGHLSMWTANTAEQVTKHPSRSGLCSVRQNADSDHTQPTVDCSSKRNVSSAERNLLQRDAHVPPCLAAESVVGRLQNGEQPVFNLTVDDVGEYFANGFLVHNCDSLEMAIRTMQQVMSTSNEPADHYEQIEVY
mgnify:CR=1 FL=1